MPEHLQSRPANKNELRLFVSSTFRDLMPEREQLVKKVFPRIRKECRERGVEFTEIDLRWGITEEESRSGRTIRICLEEIDRCRPYFIGIIGSRYGWIPGITEIEKDEEMLKEFPWLREYAASDKSIIEMEFAHGTILRKNDSAFFYEQTIIESERANAISTYISDDELRVGVNGINPLDNLKKNLQSTGVPYRRFGDPEELGEQVFQDILTILDRDFPQKRQLTPLERERIEHEAYSQNRRQSYVANPEYYEAFVKHVESDGPPLIIWGRSGLGKSALMAYLAHEYQMQNPNAFVVQHFIGAAEGSDPEDVMRQVMMEIKERYHLADAIPTDDNTLREEFPVWLAKVGQNPLHTQNPLLFKEGAGGGSPSDTQPPPSPRLRKAGEQDKLVLFIDALNQLTGIAPELHWLPEFIPPNVRLVVSTTTDSLPLEQLRKRKWNELELQPLTEHQRESISKEFLSRFRKSLTESDLHTLSANPKSSSPLFLRTVLEELRIFGHHQSLHDTLTDYLSSADERELFQKVLARMERDHGESAVRNVMTAIWASRHGLSESELMQITGKPRMELSELMIAMEYHLMTREGFHTFFHNFLREAIERRYVPDESSRKSAHAELGEYFATREFGHRRMNEEPWQWQAAEENEKLKSSLLEPGMIALLETDHERYEAFGYWRAFDKVGIDAGYIPRLMNAGLRASKVVEVFKNAIDLLVLADQHYQAEDFFAAGYSMIEKLDLDDEQRLWLRQREILILNHLGKTDEVIARCEEMLRGEEAMTLYPKLRVELLDNLAHAHSGKGHYEEAEKVLRISIAECEKLYGHNNSEMPSMLNSLATNLTWQGRYDEAEAYLTMLVERAMERFGGGNPQTANAMMQLASCRLRAGKLDGLVEELIHAQAIFTHSLGPKHYLTCVCRMRMASVKLQLNEIESARSISMDVVEIMTEKYPEHADTTNWAITLGYTYYMEDDYASAIPYYEKYLPRFKELLGSENPVVLRAYNRLKEMQEKLDSAGVQALSKAS